MDPNSLEASYNQKREKIIYDLTAVILQALDNGSLIMEETKQIAQFILDKTRAAKSRDDLKSFLEELTKKYPLFSEISSKLQQFILTEQVAEQTKHEDQQKIEVIKNQLNQLANLPN